MNIINAWNEAKLGESIGRHNMENPKSIKKTGTILRLEQVSEYADYSVFTADDWEIVKTNKKAIVEYYNPHENLIRQCEEQNQEIPPYGALLKHTIEWEE